MLYLGYELYELSDLVWIRWSYKSWVLIWGEHDVCMRWFMELKWWVWYGFDMRHEWRWINECGMVLVGNTFLHLWFVKNEWNGSNMKYKWGWIVKVDMIYIYIYIPVRVKYYWFDYDWSVLVRNSLESLGETFRVALQWSERNSMALLVGVHGGAPSIWSGKDSR